MAPKFAVSVDVLLHGFGYFIVPGIMFAAWYPFRESNEVKERRIEEKYGSSVRAAREGRKNMQVMMNSEFF